VSSLIPLVDPVEVTSWRYSMIYPADKLKWWDQLFPIIPLSGIILFVYIIIYKDCT
jgi:hypothetical protein